MDLLVDAMFLAERAAALLRSERASVAESASLVVACDDFLSRCAAWQREQMQVQESGPATGQLSLPSRGQNGDSTVAGPGVLDEDCRAVVNAWNELALLEGLPRVSRVAGARATALRARLKDYGRETLLAAIRRIPDSDFLCGRTGRGGWRASFDFLLRRLTVQKILEGNYDGPAGPDTDHFATTERIA